MITADSGGSNGNRRRTWKAELATLAAETGLAISVCHLPPDSGSYPTGIKISDRAMQTLPITRHEFHGDWNYTLHPTRDTPEPD